VKDLLKLVLLRAEIAKEAGCHGIVCSGQEVAAVKARFPELIAVTPAFGPRGRSSARRPEEDRHTGGCGPLRCGFYRGRPSHSGCRGPGRRSREGGRRDRINVLEISFHLLPQLRPR